MSYPKLWDEARVRAVFTTESRQKERDLFLLTHRPLRRIRVDFCKEHGATESFIDEEQLRAIIQSGSLAADNRLFFVVGEAGCGKSEICQWLEYAADTSRSIPIHIPRSMTSAAGVLSLLRRHLVEETSGALAHAPIQTQVEYIALSAVVLLYERGSSVLTPAHMWAPLLTSGVLRQDLEVYLQGLIAGEPSPEILSAERVPRLCLDVGIVVQPASLDAVVCELQRLLTQAAEQVLWLGDLRSLLAQLSEKAVSQRRRPLLLIEDITAFQALGDILLDYLLDLTSGHFDAVIGVTTGFERTQLAGASLAGDLTHIHHRLRARFVLTDDHGRTYWLEEDLLGLTRSYLRAVRTPIAQDSQYEHIFGSDLYPFTPTALRRAFDSLYEEGNVRQTPRLLIEHVLAGALLADEIPSLTLDRSMYIQTPPNAFRTDAITDTRLESLLRWYGEIEDEVISLDLRIPALWGVPVPIEIQRGGRLEVQRAYISSPPSAAPLAADWQYALRELQQWLSHGGLYPSRETLKQGIERVLLGLGDPRALSSRDSLSIHRAEVYYARGDERLPIFLGRGSGDQPSTGVSVKVQINGSPEERTILEELTYLSLSGTEVAHVCQNLALTLEWAQEIWDGYHAVVRALLAERLGGIPLEHLIFTAWRMISTLRAAPWDDLPHVMGWDMTEQPYSQISPWSPQHHATCYRAGERLILWHETVRRLFIGAFMLRDTLLDQRRIEGALAQIDTALIISQLAVLPLASLKSLPFKIRPGGQTLYELLSPLQRYAQALSQLDIAAAVEIDLTDLDQRSRHLVCQVDLDISLLRQQLEALRWRCGEVGVIWRDSWDIALAILSELGPDELRELQADIQAIVQAGQLSEMRQRRDIWMYHGFRHQLRLILQHPYWKALETLRDIQRALLQTARARYRQDGRQITSTRAYSALLCTVEDIQQELTHG